MRPPGSLAPMSTILVKIDGVEGEATLAGYEGQIECRSLRHAIVHPLAASGMAHPEEGVSWRGAVDSWHGPIELAHSVDKASPLLRLAACDGRNLGTVVITRMRPARKAAGTQPAEVIVLGNALLARVDVDTPVDPKTGLPGEEPVETFSLEYGEITWDYRYRQAAGNEVSVLGSWTRSSWTPFLAMLVPFSGPALGVLADRFSVSEEQGRGWQGSAVVDLGPGRKLPLSGSLATALGIGLAPGSSFVLSLVVGSGMGAGLVVRNWPCVVNSVVAIPRRNGAPADSVCRVRFSDPLGHLAQRPVWGAYGNCSPGEILGGALAAAAGGDGRPALDLRLPGMPPVRIGQFLRDALREVPYAIAVGETLESWLDGVLGRLGVRIEMQGYRSGEILVMLRDSPPSGLPFVTTLEEGEVSPVNATVHSLRLAPSVRERGWVVDFPAHRLGQPGPVEAVVQAEGLTAEEGGLRAGFAGERAAFGTARLTLAGTRPGLAPGARIEIVDQTVGGLALWQVAGITHAHADGFYWNHCELRPGGMAWRPPIPDEGLPLLVSGIVDDGESEAGESVARDREGRIPVRFSFEPNLGEDEDDGAADGALAEWPHRIALSVVEPMAGGRHGFVPAHRQGDICRISVHSPFYAEVLGFAYRDDRRLGQDLADSSAAVIVRHRPESADPDPWSGFVFRPGDESSADEETQE